MPPGGVEALHLKDCRSTSPLRRSVRMVGECASVHHFVTCKLITSAILADTRICAGMACAQARRSDEIGQLPSAKTDPGSLIQRFATSDRLNSHAESGSAPIHVCRDVLSYRGSGPGRSAEQAQEQ